jgi:RNA polymerase sigma-70 factor (ECF subfamily)
MVAGRTKEKPDSDVGAVLYRRFRAGDSAAFEQLVVLYRSSLVSYINGFVDDRHEAEDLALDAFAELAIGTRFKGQSSLKTYLFAIGRHLALRYVKRYKGTERIPLDEIIDGIRGAESSIEEDYLQTEQQERLHTAMRKLKPDHREALYLVHFESMSYSDTGKTMNKTEKQIRNLLYTAKASLKKMLTEEEGLTDGNP